LANVSNWLKTPSPAKKETIPAAPIAIAKVPNPAAKATSAPDNKYNAAAFSKVIAPKKFTNPSATAVTIVANPSNADFIALPNDSTKGDSLDKA
jgi:hypothetical protein